VYIIQSPAQVFCSKYHIFTTSLDPLQSDGSMFSNSCGGKFFFLSPHALSPALVPTPPAVEWFSVLFRGGKAAGTWRWPTTPNLTPRLIFGRAIPLLPASSVLSTDHKCAFIACYREKWRHNCWWPFRTETRVSLNTICICDRKLELVGVLCLAITESPMECYGKRSFCVKPTLAPGFTLIIAYYTKCSKINATNVEYTFISKL
jgi:hypothetical protein